MTNPIFFFLVLILAIIITFKRPIIGLVIILLLETKFFGFIRLEVLPYLQITSSFRINIEDTFTIPLVSRSFYILIRKHERPLFLIPILLFWIAIIFSFIYGTYSGTSDLFSGGGRILRIVILYGLYFVILYAVDSPRKMGTFIKIIYGFAIIGLIIQFMENINGKYFVINIDWDQFLGEDPYFIKIGGNSVAYIWNRVQYYLYITFFLSFSYNLSIKKKNWWHITFAMFAITGFILMLIRGWFIYICVGSIVMFFLSGNYFLFFKKYFLILSALLFSIFIFSLMISQFKPEVIFNNFYFRIITLLDYQREADFIGRTNMWALQYTSFLRSPIFGLGPGKDAISTINTDTGMVNTLLLYGISGLLAVIIIIISIFNKAYKLWKHPSTQREKAYVLGLIGIMSGIVFGYGFYFDAFTLLPIIPILVMGILDRINFFQKEK